MAVWRELSRRLDLTVGLYSETEPGRRWPLPKSGSLTMEALPTWRISRGEVHVYLPKPRRIWSRQAADVLIVGGWESPASWTMMHWAKRRGMKIIVFTESTLASRRHSSRLVDKVRSRFFREADHVITPGISATQAVRKMAIPESKITTLMNCVDNQEWRVVHDLRKRTRSSGHHFLFVGRLIPLKNVVNLIDAFQARAKDDDRLLIAGDGPLRAQLEAQVRSQGIGGVEFLGHVLHEDLAALYARGHTLVLPSTQEVWGLVANEALASGLHVVLSDLCGAAASLGQMPGVYVADPSVDSIGRQMLASKSDWRGAIEDPEIMEYGPERFADEVTALCARLVEFG